MLTPLDKLRELFREWSGLKARAILPLPQSGSARKYYRISDGRQTAIGVYHTDRKENRAFVYFARHFRSASIPVPEIYSDDPDNNVYLQEDLGDTMLFDLCEKESDPGIEAMIINCLEQSVSWLVRLQVDGHQGLDYSIATPRQSFDKQSMMWDLNYFKYHFIKLAGINFDEQKLEDDFESLAAYLSSAPRDFFMFRDFQSRNIMVRDSKVWFIDFQGGRMGYPAYDLASLLFDAKAGFSPGLRENIKGIYLDEISGTGKINPEVFNDYYPGFVLIRKMQAMGAFGFRGLIERKAHFLQSIPPAMKNLEWIIENYRPGPDIPELWRILSILPGSTFTKRVEEQIEELDFNN